MIAPLLVLGAPYLASLIIQYVVIPLFSLWYGPVATGGWSAKAKEWRDAIAGWLILLYLGAVIWGVVADALKHPFVLGHVHPKNPYAYSD